MRPISTIPPAVVVTGLSQGAVELPLANPPVVTSSCFHAILLFAGLNATSRLIDSEFGTDATSSWNTAPPLLITGANGTLGRAMARLCETRGLAYHLLGRADMDIADRTSVESVIDGLRPWALVNAAGFVRVDDAEHDSIACYRENTIGPELLADACSARGVPLVTFSSDLVFDGALGRPYVESDPVHPLNVYGQSKAEAEALVARTHPAALVIRTSAFFGPWDDYNFVTVLLRTLNEGQPFLAADDAQISPTYVPDLVHASLDLLIDEERGIWHLANRGSMTWFELGREVAEQAGLDAGLVIGCPTAKLGLKAERPRYSVLGSERGLLMPPLEDALARYFQDRTMESDELRSRSGYRRWSLPRMAKPRKIPTTRATNPAAMVLTVPIWAAALVVANPA